ncbi:MAG: hypothetical protein ACI8UO_004255 [Verrucomicrobiales bacterium]|jgi:hypothetical protein
MAVVTTIALATSFSIVMLFRQVIQSHDGQARSQLRIDYAQKEDALLRSLISIVPLRAIDAMQPDSALVPESMEWEAIFNEAISLASADQAIDEVTLQSFGVENLISANPGNSTTAASTLVSPIRGDQDMVNSGTLASMDLILDSRFAEKLPDPLTASQAVMILDAKYPIITEEKVFPAGWSTSAQLSTDDYPLYNLIPYPNIRFGYGTPGTPFVAKRNWWAFQVTFGSDIVNINGPQRSKNYVLSLYEVPSQLPIAAEAFMSVGAHAGGADWTNVSIDGGIFGGKLDTSPGFALPDGNLSARNRIALGSGTTIQGQAASNNFGDFGVREEFFANHFGDLQSTSLAADSGRVAFISINRGLDFFEYAATPQNNLIAPTSWDNYSSGAQRCAMRLFVTRVSSSLDQTPTELTLFYKTGAGESSVTLDRAVNWSSSGTAAGDEIPFQTEHTETGRKALVVYLERLPAYLASLGAAGIDVNSSMVINPDSTNDLNVKNPEFPSVGTDMAVVLRESGDLSSFGSTGFSLVTNVRLYFADDFNIVSVPQPSGSGLPSGEAFYPPVSLYAPEKRYGTTLKIRPVDYSGQLNSLAVGDADAVRPLDFRAGTYEEVTPNLITADLKSIRSPAELPPISLMNWLIVVEEVF